MGSLARAIARARVGLALGALALTLAAPGCHLFASFEQGEPTFVGDGATADGSRPDADGGASGDADAASGCTGPSCPGVLVDHVAFGLRHACALLDNATVWCWGDNDAAQLGSPTTAAGGSAKPVAVALPSPVRALSAHGNASCAVAGAQREVYCWGSNDDGALGSGADKVDQSATPLRVPGLSDIRALDSGDQFACALDNGGTVRCWGRNGSGQLGSSQVRDRSSTPLVVPGVKADALACGRVHCCVVDAAGAVRCWGGNGAGQVDGASSGGAKAVALVDVGSGGAEDVSAFGDHTCARMRDSTAWCWGDNSFAQIRSPASSSLVPVRVASKIRDVVAGLAFTCLVDDNQSLFCRGADSYGQLGRGPENRGNPGLEAVLLPLAKPDVSGVFTGAAVACALADKRLYCWGRNTAGLVGDGRRARVFAGQAIEQAGGALVARAHRTCVIGSSSTICHGSNSSGQLGSGNPIALKVPSPIAAQKGLALGAAHSCGVVRDVVAAADVVSCVGQGTFGQLDGTVGQPVTTTPTTVRMPLPQRVAAGSRHTCATSGKGFVYCWGSNGSGQLGRPAAGSLTPQKPFNAAVPTQSWARVVASGDTTCALSVSGQLFCWGDNRFGKLGTGVTTAYDAQPKRVLVSGGAAPIVDVALGRRHGCLLDGQGDVYCWGDNSSGQLGTSTSVARSNTPRKVNLAAGAAATLLATGGAHTCVVRAGALWCWGANDALQAGASLPTDVLSSPGIVLLPQPGPVIAVAAGLRHTCVAVGTRLDSSRVFCFGERFHSQLGSELLVDWKPRRALQ